jgi:hypothetical protein
MLTTSAAPATITFTIVNFKPFASGSLTAMVTGTPGSVPPPDATVTVSQQGGGPSDPSVTLGSDQKSIVVTRPGAGSNKAVLHITVAGGYTVVGLVFQQVDRASNSNAFGHFTRSAADPNVLEVIDTDDANSNWEFYVVVQDNSSGNFGVIDPLITNA